MVKENLVSSVKVPRISTLKNNDILEFGTVALASEDAKETHKYLIRKAKDAKAIIAFDPNLRFNLWDDLEELQKVTKEFSVYADIIKIGRDELEFVTGKKGEEAIKVKVVLDSHFLIGPDGAHMNVSGISGLAAKTSYVPDKAPSPSVTLMTTESISPPSIRRVQPASMAIPFAE